MKQGPKSEKFFKVHRKKDLEKISMNYIKIQYEFIGLQALEFGKLTYSELMAGYKILRKFFKKSIKIKMNASCVYGVTKGTKESRMGKGKGSRYMWVCNVRRGMILYEITYKSSFYSKEDIMKYLVMVNDKLSISCKIVLLNY